MTALFALSRKKDCGEGRWQKQHSGVKQSGPMVANFGEQTEKDGAESGRNAADIV